MTTEIDNHTPAEHLSSLHVIGSVLASLVAALFPCVYLVTRNFSQLGTDDLLISVGLVSLHWLVIFAISFLMMKNIHKASLATTAAVIPLSLFHSGLNIVSSLIPSFYYWHGLILLVTVFGVVWYLIRKHLRQDTTVKINLVFGSIFLFLMILNVVFAVPGVIQNQKNRESVSAPVNIDSKAPVAANENLPNIYMFIFDEYSGYETLPLFTGYDNQDFYDQLNQLGFNTTKHSRNYTIWSIVEITNLLNRSVNSLNYTETEKDQMLQNPYLFSLLRSLGYDINLINDQGYISTPETYFRYQYTPQGVLSLEESLLTLLIDKSAYYPLRSASSLTRIVEINELFSVSKESSKLQESNLFTIAYMMFPHSPWVFDEFGNETDPNDRVNWENPNIYLGQLKYANKLILELVEEILENDPEATIILLSDHAYRQPRQLRDVLGQDVEDYDTKLYYMRNIFGAVYTAGEPLNIEGYSGINIVRLTLDKVLDLDLGLIAEPEE